MNNAVELSKAPDGVSMKIWRREIKHLDSPSDFLVVILAFNVPLLFILTEDEVILLNATNFAHNGRSKILLYYEYTSTNTRVSFEMVRASLLESFILNCCPTYLPIKNIPITTCEKEPRAYKNKEIYQDILRKECNLIAPFLGKNRERRQEKAAAKKKLIKHLQYIEKNKGVKA